MPENASLRVLCALLCVMVASRARVSTATGGAASPLLLPVERSSESVHGLCVSVRAARSLTRPPRQRDGDCTHWVQTAISSAAADMRQAAAAAAATRYGSVRVGRMTRNRVCRSHKAACFALLSAIPWFGAIPLSVARSGRNTSGDTRGFVCHGPPRRARPLLIPAHSVSGRFHTRRARAALTRSLAGSRSVFSHTRAST